MKEMSFGEKLKALRLEVGVSQRELADRIAMDRANLRKIELGKIPNPTEQTQRRLAEGLGMEFNEFRYRMQALELPPLTDHEKEVLSRPGIDEKLVSIAARMFRDDATMRAGLREQLQGERFDPLFEEDDEERLQSAFDGAMRNWTDKQKALLLFYIEVVNAALNDIDPPVSDGDDEVGAKAVSA